MMCLYLRSNLRIHIHFECVDVMHGSRMMATIEPKNTEVGRLEKYDFDNSFMQRGSPRRYYQNSQFIFLFRKY